MSFDGQGTFRDVTASLYEVSEIRDMDGKLGDGDIVGGIDGVCPPQNGIAGRV